MDEIHAKQTPQQLQVNQMIEDMKFQRVEQMKTLQNWGDESTAQQTKEDYTHELLQEQQILQMRALAPQVAVNGAAAVSQPPIQAPAAKESYKERREHAKKEKLAKKLCPVGTVEAMDIAADLKTGVDSRSTVITEYRTQRAIAIGVDVRNLGAFSQSYNINKKGLPVSLEDEKILQKNEAFADEYLSNDAAVRKPFLERTKQTFVNEIFGLKASDLSTENVLKNGFALRRRADFFVGIEKIQQENRDYFPDHGNPAEQTFEEKILKEQELLAAAFSLALTEKMASVGIDSVNGTLYGHSRDDKNIIKMSQEMQAKSTKLFKEVLETTEETTQKLFEREVRARAKINLNEVLDDNGNPLTEEQKAEREVQRTNTFGADVDSVHRSLTESYKHQDETFKAQYGVSFPDGATGLQYEEMKKCNTMIAENGGAYVSNREIVDLVYTDCYRTYSLVGKKSITARSYQSVADKIDVKASDPILYRLKQTADAMMLKEMDESDIMFKHASILQDIIGYLLCNKPMNDASAELLEKYRAKVQNPGQADQQGGDN
ncbi:MAG: hypothetical protein RSB39_09300 [Oscillospiraceae bacterium]